MASLFVQHVAPHLPDGRSWDDAKAEFADLVIDTVGVHAPNFRASVIAAQVLSPLDLERRFGLVDGDIFHGQLTLDQLFSAPARCWAMPTTACPCPASTCAGPAPIPAAASPACPDATLPLESFKISSAAVGCGAADVSLSGGEHPIFEAANKLGLQPGTIR